MCIYYISNLWNVKSYFCPSCNRLLNPPGSLFFIFPRSSLSLPDPHSLSQLWAQLLSCAQLDSSSLLFLFFLALRSLAFPRHHCQWHWTIWTCNLRFIWEKPNRKIFFWVPRFWARKLPPSQLLNVVNQVDEALGTSLPSCVSATPLPAAPHFASCEAITRPSLRRRRSTVKKRKGQGVKNRGWAKTVRMKNKGKVDRRKVIKKKEREGLPWWRSG